MDATDKQKIAERLIERIGLLQCPMCHKYEFALINRYITTVLQEEPNVFNLRSNSNSISSVAIVCNNCGYTSMHNIVALGLIEKQSLENPQQ